MIEQGQKLFVGELNMVDFSKGGCLSLHEAAARYAAAIRLTRYSHLYEQLLDEVDAIIDRDGRMNNEILSKALGVKSEVIGFLRKKYPRLSQVIAAYGRLKKDNHMFLLNGKQVGGGRYDLKHKNRLTLAETACVKK